jgi:uncharacterized protein YkwD
MKRPLHQLTPRALVGALFSVVFLATMNLGSLHAWASGLTAQETLDLDLAEQRLADAQPEQRDAAYTALLQHKPQALPFLQRALLARWEAACARALENKPLRELEKLAQDREELDHRRRAALDLIFNEERYFYPFHPSLCPPDLARTYGPVQKKVNELVIDLREVWKPTRRVKLPPSFHELVAELRWDQDRAGEHAWPLALPRQLAPWLLTVPSAASSVNIQTFAWEADGYKRHSRDRAVAARNASAWSRKTQKRLSADQRASAEEQQQVRLCNEYRLMFGSPALAWNVSLQQAAGWHSDYMQLTGDFGHQEQGRAGRHSISERGRLAGYSEEVTENCGQSGSSPEGAHLGWTQSSEHHRNLLRAEFTELGSANSGSYWTQNFGNDKAFDNELESWQD